MFLLSVFLAFGIIVLFWYYDPLPNPQENSKKSDVEVISIEIEIKACRCFISLLLNSL